MDAGLVAEKAASQTGLKPQLLVRFLGHEHTPAVELQVALGFDVRLIPGAQETTEDPGHVGDSGSGPRLRPVGPYILDLGSAQSAELKSPRSQST
jgi:hypothetical protein